MRKPYAIGVLLLAVTAATQAPAAPVNGRNIGVFTGGGVLAPSQKPGNPSQTVRPANASTPLTKAECEGLGGTVVIDFGCGLDRAAACTTVDPNGVVRKVCINK